MTFPFLLRTALPATDARRAAGPLALQWGRGIIKFRKVQIKPA